MALGVLGTGLGMGKEIFIFESPVSLLLKIKGRKNKACVLRASFGRPWGAALEAD